MYIPFAGRFGKLDNTGRQVYILYVKTAGCVRADYRTCMGSKVLLQLMLLSLNSDE
jgi:hypothetical protein